MLEPEPRSPRTNKKARQQKQASGTKAQSKTRQRYLLCWSLAMFPLNQPCQTPPLRREGEADGRSTSKRKKKRKDRRRKRKMQKQIEKSSRPPRDHHRRPTAKGVKAARGETTFKAPSIFFLCLPACPPFRVWREVEQRVLTSKSGENKERERAVVCLGYGIPLLIFLPLSS